MKETSMQYVPSNASKRHNVKTEEITAAFVAVGWIGELRARPQYIHGLAAAGANIRGW